MKRIAIVGVGPTGIYTFYELVKRGEPLAITLFEKEAQAGVGMPYSDDNTAAQMLANIASIEIPPIDLTYLQWLQQQSDDWLSNSHLSRLLLAFAFHRERHRSLAAGHHQIDIGKDLGIEQRPVQRTLAVVYFVTRT